MRRQRNCTLTSKHQVRLQKTKKASRRAGDGLITLIGKMASIVFLGKERLRVPMVKQLRHLLLSSRSLWFPSVTYCSKFLTAM